MEGTGSHGAGLLRFLTDYGLPVVEVDRPDRSTPPTHRQDRHHRRRVRRPSCALRPRQRLSRYLERIRGNDYHAAYQQLCSDVLWGYTESDHAAFLREQGPFVSYSIGDPTRSTGIDGTYLSYPVSLAHADGTALVVRLAVHLETGGPKICDDGTWRK
ncbi:hypothetical protein U2F26_30030 [Micromonospora sp. 4G57]|uniref:Uncharacterized protein n=1 Tax=Micromonospora sicca TaxID=2202420 RepID=A0ABU5JLU4_9ACTN|nr:MULTISPECIES: hypothetical protein [unclassified Micromonospora]MDZ5446917.1 hypothetical protein [Micromonospora sp. 4G57]MDZ5493595.1 hypothetical protein [Micromonospora sp. 4G53]